MTSFVQVSSVSCSPVRHNVKVEYRVIPVGENLISSNGFLTETIAEFPMTKIERIINNDEEKKDKKNNHHHNMCSRHCLHEQMKNDFYLGNDERRTKIFYLFELIYYMFYFMSKEVE